MLGEISRVLSTLAEGPLFSSTTGFHFVYSCCHHYPTSRKERRKWRKEAFFFFFFFKMSPLCCTCSLCFSWDYGHLTTRRNSEIFFVFKLFWLKVRRKWVLVGEWMGSEEWWAVSSPLVTQLLMHTVSHTFLLKGSTRFHSAQSSPSLGNMECSTLSLDITLQGLVTYTLIEKLISPVHTHTHARTQAHTHTTH